MNFKKLFKNKYKYYLSEDFSIDLKHWDIDIPNKILGFAPTENVYGYTERDGSNLTLHLPVGYKWDGATGAIDTKEGMVASAVHDMLCVYAEIISILRIENSGEAGVFSDYYILRKKADKEYYRILIHSGFNKHRAKLRYIAVRAYGVFKGVLYYGNF